ncbi:hypothetical protein [Mesorhizobium sp. CN2-181]|uniref:hypothetical protein n=1 Tax=Mesorhizobium yinganensis TaxID=3157707 RepID=UPI0032B78ED3
MDNSTYRERAGVLVSALVVLALVAVGPVQLVVQVWTAQPVTFDQTWMVTLAGMAGTAFGFLIGKQTTNAGVSGSATVSLPVQVTAEPPKRED